MTIEMGSSRNGPAHRTLNPRKTETGFVERATVPQQDALHKFVNDARTPAPIAYGIKSYLDRGTLTKEQASEILDMLIAHANRPKSNPVKEPGIYVDPKTGAFYLVKLSQVNRLYALDLVILDRGECNEDGTWRVKPRFEWKYENGGHKANKVIQANWKATKQQIKQWGDVWGFCLKCHAELTVQKSIDQGMGDTCYKNQFGK